MLFGQYSEACGKTIIVHLWSQNICGWHYFDVVSIQNIFFMFVLFFGWKQEVPVQLRLPWTKMKKQDNQQTFLHAKIYHALWESILPLLRVCTVSFTSFSFSQRLFFVFLNPFNTIDKPQGHIILRAKYLSSNLNFVKFEWSVQELTKGRRTHYFMLGAIHK